MFRSLRRVAHALSTGSAKVYLTEILLILFSLWIAVSVDRCRENDRKQAKLDEYLKAILVDVQKEKETCQYNLYDCNQDIDKLKLAIDALQYDHPDSLKVGWESFLNVYWRGVFRTFPPTTFDIMMQSGDGALISDLSLRNEVSAIFAFRSTVIRADLENFDKQTQVCIEQLGQYVDLKKLTQGDNFAECLTDKEGFYRTPRNELFVLARTASLRAFHLEAAIEDLDSLEKKLQKQIELSGK